jgi:hypothetical protein
VIFSDLARREEQQDRRDTTKEDHSARVLQGVDLRSSRSLNIRKERSFACSRTDSVPACSHA